MLSDHLIIALELTVNLVCECVCVLQPWAQNKLVSTTNILISDTSKH